VPKRSAGILLYRRVTGTGLEVFLVHPGGPLWAKKDSGAWSIPKGEYNADENPQAAAVRELKEETGLEISPELVMRLAALGEIKQLSGKIVTAFACQLLDETDFDAARIQSNTFTMEWPPRSGKQVEFPEVDRAAWFTIEVACEKILPRQAPFLDRLLTLLREGE
jgi:predicted NUDIX family NTP pyrophosphohydrolase